MRTQLVWVVKRVNWSRCLHRGASPSVEESEVCVFLGSIGRLPVCCDTYATKVKIRPQLRIVFLMMFSSLLTCKL